jgi:hypothetical protein
MLVTLALAPDLDRDAEPLADDGLNGIEQAGGIVALDPIAEERIGNPNDQGVAFAVEPEAHIAAEPECESCGTDAVGYSQP